MTPTELWTFGHSTRSAPETVELLRDNRIGRVVDVRSIAGSRHNPQFGSQSMAEWLPDAGIDYGRIEALGGRRRTRGVDPEINAGWTNDSFHSYADWTLGEEFEGAWPSWMIWCQNLAHEPPSCAPRRCPGDAIAA